MVCNVTGMDSLGEAFNPVVYGDLPCPRKIIVTLDENAVRVEKIHLRRREVGLNLLLLRSEMSSPSYWSRRKVLIIK